MPFNFFLTLSLSVILLLSPSLSACTKETKKEFSLSENVVAVVNRENIYKEDFKSALEHFIAKYKIPSANTASGNRSPQQTVLDQLISNKLYEQEIRRLSITVSVKELDDELRLITGDYTQEEFSRRLKDKNISYAKWVEDIRKNLLIQKLLKREILQKITISEKEMKDYYEANRSEFTLPERAKISHIIISDESEARKVYEEIQSGADFNEKAKEHSLGVDSQSGGQMGIFSPGQLPDAFDKSIFKLKPGQYSDVVKTPYGYHLFKVEENYEATVMTFEESKETIRNTLLKKKEAEAFTGWLHALKAKSVITINESYINQSNG